MLQTLTDATPDELEEIAKETIDDIKNIGSDKDVMLKVLGVVDSNEKMRSYQKCLMIYTDIVTYMFFWSILCCPKN